ncbi:Plasmodium vivax Vir protein, putative [Plasmodium vivax]|uniref:Vir protein, putative n=1 Tax=Plasmodium vivax TaxID=5855 RepID=A0A1G4EIW7_PLAVI|nr:Plasmodium vivax Vir protein, putative [Plasmodium vivax]
MELWKQWKDLYDYIKNKKDIQNIINSDNKLCEIYPKYHTYITGIYKTYKKECCEGYNGNCPHEINFSEWCKQEDILTELTCNKSSEAPVSSAESGQVIATNLKVSDGEEKIDEGQENAESEGLTQRGIRKK